MCFGIFFDSFLFYFCMKNVQKLPPLQDVISLSFLPQQQKGRCSHYQAPISYESVLLLFGKG